MAFLFAHIGHHKTGTTTLQRLVFPHLTRSAFLDTNSPAAKQFKRCFSLSSLVWQEHGQAIFEDLISESSGRENIVVSGEGMSQHRIFASPSEPNSQRRDPVALASHLAECSALSKRFGLTLRVILGIRRQDQYFGSRYAEHGNRSGNPCQEDFEEQVRAIVDPLRRYFTCGIWLDYCRMHSLLSDVAGHENVLIFPLEELADQPENYIARLSAFLDEKLHVNNIASQNVRRIGPDLWAIEKKMMRKALRKKRFGWLRSKFTHPTLIALTPELKEHILAVYRDGNRSLSTDLSMALDRFGYYAWPVLVVTKLSGIYLNAALAGPGVV